MKNTKKVLSVVLAVVMALSALTLVAFAHSYTGVEDSTTTSVKYEVTQVASATNKDGETYTAVNNDIYAVTVYVKAAAGTGIAKLQLPVMYDKTKFEPMMTVIEGDLYCCNDFMYDEYDMHSFDFYTLPARYDDDLSYDKNGTATTNKLQIKCYGMKHATVAPGLAKTVDFVSTHDPRYAEWSKTFTASEIADTGFAFFDLDLVSNYVKGVSCINTSYGKLVNDEYIDVITLYFHRIDGVTEEACYGSEFGAKSGDQFGIDLVSRAAVMGSGNGGGLDLTATNYLTQVNFINAAVEAPVKPLMTLTAAGGAKSQAIAFNLAEGATPAYTADDVTSVDYRFVAQFSTTAFPIDYNTDGTVNATDIDEVGFVMAKVGDATIAQIEALDAAAVAGLSKDEGAIRKCWTAKISTDMAGGAAFAFSCRIKGIAVTGGTVAAEYIAVPYVISAGTLTFGQGMTSTVQAKYDANIAKFLANKNA